jgi:hypothetical protein
MLPPPRLRLFVCIVERYLGAFGTGRLSPRSAGKRSSFGACPIVAPRLGGFDAAFAINPRGGRDLRGDVMLGSEQVSSFMSIERHTMVLSAFYHSTSLGLKDGHRRRRSGTIRWKAMALRETLRFETAPILNPKGAGNTIIGRVIWERRSN